MGAAGSKLEKALGDQFPEGERYFGLENFGNTCYCNSVLQVFSIDATIFFLLLRPIYAFLSFILCSHSILSIDSFFFLLQDCVFFLVVLIFYGLFVLWNVFLVLDVLLTCLAKF